MTTTRPGLYPLHDLLELNITLPEESLYLQGGYPVGLPVPSADHNGKLNRSGLWHQYLDANGIRNADWLDAAQTMTLSATKLAYNVGGNVLTTGATVATRGVHLVFGTRIETDAAFLNQVGTITGDPLIYPGATVPGRIWIYANEAGTSRIESVGPATADSPGAGEVTLVGVQVDGTGVVTNGNLTPASPLPATLLRIAQQVRMIYLLLENLNTVLEIYGGGVTGGDPAVLVDADIGPGLNLTNSSPSDDAAFISASGGATALHVTSAKRVIYAEANGNAPGLQVDHYGMGDGAYIHATDAGVGMTIAADNNSALVCTGGASSQVIVSTADAGIAVRGVATGTGVGVSGVGGNSATSVGVQASATHADANAIEGFTQNTANSGAIGVRGIGRGAGIGMHAQATGTGYALLVTADTTTPTRAASRFVPQDADPTTPQQGDWLFNSARTASGKFRGYTTQWESMHSSAKGWVRQWGSAAAGGPIAAGSGNLSLAQITPEVTGEVLVSATGSLEFSVDTGVCTVTLTDVTSGVTVATQTERAIDTDAVAPNVRSFAIRGVRTLPNTSTRTFAVVITATTGTITYANVVCLVDGVQ